MTPKEFTHYFKGAIELGGLTDLNQEKLLKVSEKLNGVKLDSSEESAFCTWFKGFLEAVDNIGLDANQLKKIETKLSDLGKLEFPPISANPNIGHNSSVNVVSQKHGVRC